MKHNKGAGMKRLVLVLLAVVLMCGVSHAAQVVETIIDDVTLAKGSATDNGTAQIVGADKVAFFVTYDSSRTTAAVTATVQAAISYDGTNWATANWFDVAGGATPQSSETLSTDTTYVGWLDKGLAGQQLKITVTLDNAAVYGAGDTADVSVNVVEKK